MGSQVAETVPTYLVKKAVRIYTESRCKSKKQKEDTDAGLRRLASKSKAKIEARRKQDLEKRISLWNSDALAKFANADRLKLLLPHPSSVPERIGWQDGSVLGEASEFDKYAKQPSVRILQKSTRIFCGSPSGYPLM